MSTFVNRIFAGRSNHRASVLEDEGTSSLGKKLLLGLGSVLGKFDGAAIEGLCGPGVYYGVAISEVFSRREECASFWKTPEGTCRRGGTNG